MAEKKKYLIKVWKVSGVKVKNKDSNKESYVVSEESSNDGFDLVQEKIIKSYESNIKNLHVPKSFRATYEEIKEEQTVKK
mgnify:CR=1 FL=1|jgi:hypothetical protein